MEDEVRPKGLEDGNDLVAVRDAAEAPLDVKRRSKVPDLLADGVEGQFRVIEQQQPRRLHGSDLAAQLGADGAARAGD